VKLYLVQHGDSLPKEVDPSRGLSKQGKKNVIRLEALLANGGVQVSQILHSGKKRAEQTALLLQNCLSTGGEFGQVDGIAPLDRVDIVVAELETWQEDIMLVGHLPYMEKLVSHLVCGDKDAQLVGFQPGTVVCLELKEAGKWIISLMVRPDMKW